MSCWGEVRLNLGWVGSCSSGEWGCAWGHVRVQSPPAAPSAVSCQLSCPSWHHNAASVPNNTSGLFCSSVLPVVSDLIPAYPQQSRLEVLFSTESLCRKGFARQLILRGSEEPTANERNSPISKKDLGDFSSLAILSTLPGEKTSSLWEKRQQLLLLRTLCKFHSPLQVTKEQVNRFFCYSPPGEAEKWQWVSSSCHCLALGYICGDPMLWRTRRGERNFWGASPAPQMRDLLLPSTALWWFFILRASWMTKVGQYQICMKPGGF